MSINADFRQRAVVRPEEAAWTPSPTPGVERLPLDRCGADGACATSLVRFAPGAALARRQREDGEEAFVIEGAFTDGDGEHRQGAYLRDPRGSSHEPSSETGCLLYVKRWRFEPADAEPVSIEADAGEWRKAGEGFAIKSLHHFDGVTTFLVRLDPGASVTRMLHPDGEEMLVVSGACSDGAREYSALTWIRDPGGHAQSLSSRDGCTLFVKTGHVGAAAKEAERLGD